MLCSSPHHKLLCRHMFPMFGDPDEGIQGSSITSHRPTAPANHISSNWYCYVSFWAMPPHPHPKHGSAGARWWTSSPVILLDKLRRVVQSSPVLAIRQGLLVDTPVHLPTPGYNMYTCHTVVYYSTYTTSRYCCTPTPGICIQVPQATPGGGHWLIYKCSLIST